MYIKTWILIAACALTLGSGAGCGTSGSTEGTASNTVDSQVVATSTATEEAAPTLDFQTFLKRFPEQSLPYELRAKQAPSGQAITAEEGMAFFQRSTPEMRAEVRLPDHGGRVSLIISERPLEDVIYSWNVLEKDGKLVSQKMIAGVEAGDLWSVRFKIVGEAEVTVMSFSGVDETGDSLWSRDGVKYLMGAEGNLVENR